MVSIMMLGGEERNVIVMIVIDSFCVIFVLDYFFVLQKFIIVGMQVVELFVILDKSLIESLEEMSDVDFM